TATARAAPAPSSRPRTHGHLKLQPVPQLRPEHPARDRRPRHRHQDAPVPRNPNPPPSPAPNIPPVTAAPVPVIRTTESSGTARLAGCSPVAATAVGLGVLTFATPAPFRFRRTPRPLRLPRPHRLRLIRSDAFIQRRPVRQRHTVPRLRHLLHPHTQFHRSLAPSFRGPPPANAPIATRAIAR